MGLRKYVRQAKPTQENKVNYVSKVQIACEAVEKLPQEKQLNIDSLVSAESSPVPTQMYEAAGTMVALHGSNLSKSNLDATMGHPEFSPVAKKWIEEFLKVHSNKEALDALLNWAALTGSGVNKIENKTFKDFIHKNINEYYDVAPATFQVPTAEKPNTADMICIKNGTRQSLINTVKEISRLPENKQSTRVNTDEKGLVTLMNDKGKEVVSYYQVSLKKGFEDARIGRVTTFVNKNFAGGISLGSPTQAADLRRGQTQDLPEGIFSDMFDKFKDIVSGGFKNFVGWVKKTYLKLSQVIVGVAVKLSNRIITRNRGIKAINNVLKVTNLNESNLTTFLGEKKSQEIKVTKTLVKEFQTIDREFIKKDEINKVHNDNVALIQKLNREFTAPGREVPPILMLPNTNAGILEMNEIKNGVDKVIKSKVGDVITKSDIYLALKIGMNYSANVAIFSILKSIEKNMGKYENLSQALFSFSAEFESEAKFGNTSLPLVIAYGGKKGKAVVLGTRDDYKRDKTDELTQTGRDFNDFPVAVISVRKATSRGDTTKQLYNVIHLKTVTDFKDVGGKPEPIYLMFELIADQSRSFTLKIEGNKYQDKSKALI
tara:strand:- start:479 stop:2284 length:1806 start_codon:yes stop_codon:yes gene_type:complete